MHRGTQRHQQCNRHGNAAHTHALTHTRTLQYTGWVHRCTSNATGEATLFTHALTHTRTQQCTTGWDSWDWMGSTAWTSDTLGTRPLGPLTDREPLVRDSTVCCTSSCQHQCRPTQGGRSNKPICGTTGPVTDWGGMAAARGKHKKGVSTAPAGTRTPQDAPSTQTHNAPVTQ
jgi:hypothetical protein